ncbi:CGNR zinc finger domain-containing protein [Pseudonocardia sp. CA-107938]|uniref:CGNR zinc finger domain-containing protein n=1 Tax=Pseudonocardia sp. CA-107938 TaxID=3240021 RepID=UPI003D8EF73C
MTEHPRDSRGRILPDPSWPADRTAPDGLELVRRFCNTTNRENGADRFAEPDGFSGWLPAGPVSATDRARLVAFRAYLHRCADAHATGHAPTADLPEPLPGVAFTVAAHADGLRLEIAAAEAVDRLLGRLVLAVLDAQHRGTWPRLKACTHCGWVVYDGSKNRSARWCSMSACGGREHARAYRRRRSTTRR